MKSPEPLLGLVEWVLTHFGLTLHTQENSGERDKQSSLRTLFEAVPVRATHFDRIALDNSTRPFQGNEPCRRC
jgi:hypothetical protein